MSLHRDLNGLDPDALGFKALLQLYDLAFEAETGIKIIEERRTLMSLMAPIKDGKVVETESQTSLKKAQTANKNTT